VQPPSHDRALATHTAFTSLVLFATELQVPFNPRLRDTPTLDIVAPLKKDTKGFVAPNAKVIGNVTLGSQVSIWYGAVLRGEWQGPRVLFLQLLCYHFVCGWDSCTAACVNSVPYNVLSFDDH
jgi:hypothetical protein